MSKINEFKKEIAGIIYKFEDKDWPGGLIYHYRTPEKSINIVREKELIFADYIRLKDDDNEEIEFGIKKIKELIKNRCKSDPIWSSIYHSVDECVERFSFYTLSFCKAGDDPKLWKEYGDNYKGCVFGFDFKKPELVEPENYGENIRYLLKVIYEKDINILEEKINQLLDCFAYYLHNFPADGRMDPSLVLIIHLLSLAPMLKKDKYIFEKEYRLVMPSTIDSGKRYPCELDDNLFRGQKNKESHYAYPFEERDLKEIRIGSNAEENFEKEIYELLSSKGYPIKEIKRSKII
jgi:hypothetical protein